MPNLTRINQTQMHFTDDLNLENFKIDNVLTPVGVDNVATREFVNEKISGLNIKNSVRFASTNNFNISNPSSVIDGVSLAFGDRVLLKNQEIKSENGIYLYNGSGMTMTRTSDFDNPHVHSGDLVYVEEGTNNGKSFWILRTVDSFDLDKLNAYWKLDETDGDRVDSLGFYNLVENGGTISNETGILDNCVNMNDPDKYLSVSNCPELVDSYCSFSVSAWVYIDTAADIVFLRGQHTENSIDYDSYLLGYDNSLQKFYFTVYEDDFSTSQTVTADNFGSPLEDTWYMVSATFNISTKKLSICVNDGVFDEVILDGSTSVFITNPVFRLDSSTGIHRIDEVGFWKKALTLGNIHRLYKSGDGRTYPLPTEPIYIGESDLEFENYVLPINVLDIGDLVTREVPSGDKDEVNIDFVLSNTPISNSEMIFLNGILQNPTFDYTISATTITFINPPKSTDIILVNYLK